MAEHDENEVETIEKADSSTEVESGLHKISIPNYKPIVNAAKKKSRQTKDMLGSHFRKGEEMEKAELHPKFLEHKGKIQEIMARKRAGGAPAIEKAEITGLKPKNDNTEAYEKSYKESYKRGVANGASSAHAHANAHSYAHSLHGPKGSDVKSTVGPIQKSEHQPHPGPTKSDHQKIHDAKIQSEKEASLSTPEGEAERQKSNKAMQSKMVKSGMHEVEYVKKAEDPNIKGVHQPGFMDSKKSGTSAVGAHMAPGGAGPETNRWAKRVHEDKLAELKAMPKPNLTKSAKSGMHEVEYVGKSESIPFANYTSRGNKMPGVDNKAKAAPNAAKVMSKADMSTSTAGAPTSRPDAGFGRTIIKKEVQSGMHKVQYMKKDDSDVVDGSESGSST